jgi:hypothetical protein
LTLGLCAALAAPPALRLLATAAAALFGLAMGFSMLVLAGHFPTDVVGGYLVAGFCVFAALAVVRRWSPGQRVEPQPWAVTLAPAAALFTVVMLAALALPRVRGLLRESFSTGGLGLSAMAIVALAALLAAGLAVVARSDP